MYGSCQRGHGHWPGLGARISHEVLGRVRVHEAGHCRHQRGGGGRLLRGAELSDRVVGRGRAQQAAAEAVRAEALDEGDAKVRL